MKIFDNDYIQENEGLGAFTYLIVSFVIIISIMISVVMVKTSEIKKEPKVQTTVVETQAQEQETIETTTEETTKETTEEPTTAKPSLNLSENDKYLLAKIAMAEAEGESLETKILVIETVLNRVYSNRFPNTIENVIFQKSNGTYQFSVMCSGGRWWTTTPSSECWEAVEIVNNKTEEEICTNRILYFESCSGESWHSRNLEFVCQSDNIRFYK